ncbi:hypothetical protein HUB98_22065 [Paenibacillus barcinonensis]|uniref:Uncharacterized protein n=1 Tax=Paenibacillus barcinonensis TaxID=198119 RepID=A0A2V4VYK8_PAEBA|nr:hypothetical protein [Paenibacillus barcinonensis]PYE47188.1 hypothetical protein DFQ00_11537 [Paenibacillus barcinonensis]QKS58647.1 hypothetical protein HUB98_22065 [Paenibacillus barcinonensis]
MEKYYFIWIVFVVAVLLYRMIFQKFKQHHRENIGLSAILIIFTGSSYPLAQMNLFFVIAVIALGVYCAVWNSILLTRNGYEKPSLK